LLRDLLGVLDEATRRTIRLRAEGRSTARGVDPEWLVESASFEVLGFEEGSTDIVCEATPLEQIAPEMFAQQDMFSPVDTRTSGLGLLEQTLEDIKSGNLDSDSYDDKVLDTLGDFRKVFAHGIDVVGFRNGTGVQVVPEDIETFATLRRSIPSPERVRVAGLLDSLVASRCAFQLKLADGSTIRGHFEEEATEKFRELWNEVVVVVGEAEFKPSGAVRNVEVERIAYAEARDELWSKMPRSTQTELVSQELRRPQTAEHGLAAVIEAWPGEESDDEVAAALEDLS
jgi:hypothetical protein